MSSWGAVGTTCQKSESTEPSCFFAKSLNSDFLTARLAQSAERKALNLVVVGSSPTVGDFGVIMQAIKFEAGNQVLAASKA